MTRAVIVMNERVAAHLSAACSCRVADLAHLEATMAELGAELQEPLRVELRDLRDVIGVIAGAVKI